MSPDDLEVIWNGAHEGCDADLLSPVAWAGEKKVAPPLTGRQLPENRTARVRGHLRAYPQSSRADIAARLNLPSAAVSDTLSYLLHAKEVRWESTPPDFANRRKRVIKRYSLTDAVQFPHTQSR